MNTLSPEIIVSNTTTIASLPAIFAKLNEALQDPNCSMKRIGLLLSEDPGTASRILRLANSAFYGLPQKVNTISKAVVILGTKEIQELVYATSVVNTFKNIPQKVVDMKSFWRHSIACAVFSRELALRENKPAPDRLFVSGLLHDIGRLLIYMEDNKTSNIALKKAKFNRKPLFEIERELFGFDHTHVGSELLKRWNLPTSHIQAVELHHFPQNCSSNLDETSIIHLADFFANAFDEGSSGESRIPPLDLECVKWFDTSEEELSDFVSSSQEKIAEVISIILS